MGGVGRRRVDDPRQRDGVGPKFHPDRDGDRRRAIPERSSRARKGMLDADRKCWRTGRRRNYHPGHRAARYLTLGAMCGSRFSWLTPTFPVTSALISMARRGVASGQPRSSRGRDVSRLLAHPVDDRHRRRGQPRWHEAGAAGERDQRLAGHDPGHGQRGGNGGGSSVRPRPPRGRPRSRPAHRGNGPRRRRPACTSGEHQPALRDLADTAHRLPETNCTPSTPRSRRSLRYISTAMPE